MVVLVAVDVVTAESKTPAAVDVRISKGKRHHFGAAAPLPIRASCLGQERAEGSVESSPKLVERYGQLGHFLQNSYPHALIELQ